ncbi:MAG TPA: hypothetical protein VLV28_06940 [Gaiellaceae bacterium]|nr:hypothetical protein [Gaiellaceae bacterium]
MPVLASHPVPPGYGPSIAGGIVVAAALPVFLVAGWPVAGWVLAAILWVAGQAVSRVLQRVPLGMDNLAGSGAVALGRMVRTITAMVVLIAVTVMNQSVGISAAAVYAIAFTVEFATSLASYYGGEAGT